MPKVQEGDAVPSSSKDDDELAKPATTKGSVTPSKGPSTLVFRYILIHPNVEKKEWAIPIRNCNKQS
ncbi:hypothetical protein COP2_019520 [Malus domestica]